VKTLVKHCRILRWVGSVRSKVGDVAGEQITSRLRRRAMILIPLNVIIAVSQDKKKRRPCEKGDRAPDPAFCGRLRILRASDVFPSEISCFCWHFRRFPDGQAKFSDAPAKFSRAPAKFSRAPAKFSDAPAKFSRAPAKFSGAPAKLSRRSR
jgi:hypothetical protein